MPVNVRRQSRLTSIAHRLQSKKFRDAYLSRHIRTFLAAQIRALRGEMSQTKFAWKLGTHQSVVSRYESEDAGNLNVKTLINIARKLDIGLIVQFVNYPTFLRQSEDFTEAAFAPRSYDQSIIDRMIKDEENQVFISALKVWEQQKREQSRAGVAIASASRQPEVAHDGGNIFDFDKHRSSSARKTNKPVQSSLEHSVA